ncbi:MAG: DUF1330 domain-containing protein [Ilumatobacteraceae bacterium]
MATYLVGHIDITDREGYRAYEAGFFEVFSQFDGELVAVDDDPMAIEGDQHFTRSVIIRFPDRDSALAWYRSDAYQELAAIRWSTSSGAITLIEALA